ncbi:MAG: hypothetical protein H7Z75_16055, partial [Ferruginibacter sp.]|nr:hypothetical protein [Cytophagales bacterium]
MTNDFLGYLAEASFCLGVFAGAYRLLFGRLTHFRWNRFYLVGSVLLGTVLPLVALPAGFTEFLWPASPTELATPSPFRIGLVFSDPLPLSVGQADTALALGCVGYLLLSVYALGFFYKAWGIHRNLRTIHRLARGHPKVREGRCWLVYTRQNLPVFSFLNYIFLGPGHRQLSDQELHQVKQHERVHAAQQHTLDLLLLEAAGALFWFNPVVGYLKNSLREVHEYLADSAVIGQGENRRAYATLLIKLTTRETPVPLANGFAGKQLSRRITMLTQTHSTPVQKLRFVLALPLVALALVCCSLSGNDETPKNAPVPFATRQAASGLRIGKITWQGNTRYDEAELNRALGLKMGDAYVKEDVKQR